MPFMRFKHKLSIRGILQRANTAYLTLALNEKHTVPFQSLCFLSSPFKTKPGPLSASCRSLKRDWITVPAQVPDFWVWGTARHKNKVSEDTCAWSFTEDLAFLLSSLQHPTGLIFSPMGVIRGGDPQELSGTVAAGPWGPSCGW